MRVQKRSEARRCAVCHGELGRGASHVCGGCGAVFHGDCSRTCPSLGCRRPSALEVGLRDPAGLRFLIVGSFVTWCGAGLLLAGLAHALPSWLGLCVLSWFVLAPIVMLILVLALVASPARPSPPALSSRSADDAARMWLLLSSLL